MASGPEEAVRLQGYGEMTLRTAIATLMALPSQGRSDAAIVRVRDASQLTPGEIAELASGHWARGRDQAHGQPALDRHRGAAWCARRRCRRRWWRSFWACW